MKTDCGCDARKATLNTWRPGLGDRVETVAKPIQERILAMPEILRPDMKSIAWLLIGLIAVPMVLRKIR